MGAAVEYLIRVEAINSNGESAFGAIKMAVPLASIMIMWVLLGMVGAIDAVRRGKGMPSRCVITGML
jgi:hypothetical protein